MRQTLITVVHLYLKHQTVSSMVFDMFDEKSICVLLYTLLVL